MGLGKFGLGCGCCEEGCPGPSTEVVFNNAKMITPVVGSESPPWTSVVNNYPVGLRHKTNQIPGTYLESTYTRDPFIVKWTSANQPQDTALPVTTGFHWKPPNTLEMISWGYDPMNPSFVSTLKVIASISNVRTAGRYHLGGEFEFSKRGSSVFTRQYRYYYGLDGAYTYGPWQGGLTSGMSPMFQVRAVLWPAKATTVYGEPFTKLEYASIGAGWAGIVTAGSVPQTKKEFLTGLDLGPGEPACDWQWEITMSTELDYWSGQEIPPTGFFGQWVPTGYGLYFSRYV